MAKMVLVRKGGEFEALGKQFGVDPLLVRLLVNRGADTEEKIREYLHGTAESFHDPRKMTDMEKACALLLEKCGRQAKIRIMGDYDIDGVCATAILLKSLRLTGAAVDAVIPHRIRDGYGLNKNMIEAARKDGIDTVITCDNGISAGEEIALAKSYGITVILTDHHEVPFHETDGEKQQLLPPADAVVDPKRSDDGYPFRDICGGYVAYQFMSLFFTEEYAGKLTGGGTILENWKQMERDLRSLAAFATIGDIMPLKDENRILVKQGLKAMQETKIKGLEALLDVCGLRGVNLQAYHVGFQLGPCLNATGRIDSADRALELFLETSPEGCMQMAGDLKAMNDSRKVLTERGCREAEEQIAENGYGKDKVMVIYLPDCHESVAGIIAGRIREKYERPVFVLTDAESEAEEPVLKGSGRSVENYDMYLAMNAVEDIFLKYGGHAQAAGFSLPKGKLGEMRSRLNENCQMSLEELQDVLRVDAEVPFAYITPKLVDELALLEPFGNGNPKPVLARRKLRMRRARLLGAEGKVGKYQVADQDGTLYELTLFRENAEFKTFLERKFGAEKAGLPYREFYGGDDLVFTAAYYPKWNEYRGQRSIQYIMTHYC